MRLVLDTNVVVSGFLWESAPRRLIDAAIDGVIEIFTSPVLIEELRGVLRRKKFAKRLAFHRLSPATLIERYATLADIVEPAGVSRVVTADPTDDQIVACAIAAEADLRLRPIVIFSISSTIKTSRSSRQL